MMHIPINKRRGFTLIELSIVLLILSLLTAGIMSSLAQKTRIEKKAELERKMDAIEQAIKSYYKNSFNYALPCPTPSRTTSFAADDFGLADASNDLTDLCPNTTFNNGTVYIGDVPTKTLGIADEYAIDPWGNRFVYAVVGSFTSSVGATELRSFSSYPINAAATDALTKITIGDETAFAVSTDAILVVLSHGPDGFGAYTRDGILRSAYSANTSQRTNCHCGATGTPAAVTSNFVMRSYYEDQSNAENNFDDTLRFYKRSDFPLPSELATE